MAAGEEGASCKSSIRLPHCGGTVSYGRRAAPVLSRALGVAESRIAAGERSGAALTATLQHIIDAEPLTRLEYVAICDPQTLQPVDPLPPTVLVALAVHIGRTRLIDNAWYTVPLENL